MNIGNRIAVFFRLLLLRYSKDELAETLQVDKSSIVRWLNGTTTQLNKKSLTKISEHFNININILRQWNIDQFSVQMNFKQDEVLKITSQYKKTNLNKNDFLSFKSFSKYSTKLEEISEQYHGWYISYDTSFLNKGKYIKYLMHIKQIYDHKIIVEFSASNTKEQDKYKYNGFLYQMGMKLIIIVEEIQLYNEIVYILLNPINTVLPNMLFGIVTGVAGDDYNTPSSSKICLQYIGRDINKEDIKKKMGICERKEIDEEILKMIDNSIDNTTNFVLRAELLE